MLNKFAKHFGKTKLAQLSGAMTQAIVDWDPEGATEAAIAEIEDNYDAVNRQFSVAKAEYDKENSEAEAILALQDQRFAAATNIEAQLEQNPGNEDLTEALAAILGGIDEMQDDIETEVEEAAYAKEVMDDLKLTVDMYGDKLKTARKTMTKAAGDMKKAKRASERAADAEERQRQIAGLKSGGTGLNAALDAMNKNAAAATADADAAKRKTKMLTPNAGINNDIVAQAMNAAKGGGSGTESLQEKLARMKASRSK